jgi:hypothetical protein
MRRVIPAALLLFVLLPSFVLAQGDRIVGPADVTNGRLTILKLQVANAKKIKWMLVNPPIDNNPDVALDDADLPFASGYGGEYHFVVSAVTIDESGDVGLVLLRHTLKVGPPIGQPSPAPPAGPGQPPAPGNPGTPPPAPFDLSAWTANAVRTLVTGDAQKAATAKILAGGYRSIAASGTQLVDVKEFAKAQDQVNNAIVTGRNVSAAWAPFFKALATQLGTMKLNTIPDHVAVWPAIAAGLER